MGQPILTTSDIPVKLPVKEVVDQPFMFENRAFTMTCVSMGNPHAVFFRNDLASVELGKMGPAIEKHSIFPNFETSVASRVSLLTLSVWHKWQSQPSTGSVKKKVELSATSLLFQEVREIAEG